MKKEYDATTDQIGIKVWEKFGVDIRKNTNGEYIVVSGNVDHAKVKEINEYIATIKK